MNDFNRLVTRYTSTRFLVVLMIGVALSLALLYWFSQKSVLGIVILSLALAGLWAWANKRSRRDWAPDVHGENAYQILGVTRRADTAAIRQAFRKLEQRYHPDAVDPDQKAAAAAVFVRINEAYDLLSHDEKRFQYDALIDEDEGRIPPFAEAYSRIRDEDKHPIYADYDAFYPDTPQHEPGEWDDAREPARSKPEAAADAPPSPPHDQPQGTDPGRQSVGETPEPVLEVDIPDSIREAMGLPPNASPPAPDQRPGR